MYACIYQLTIFIPAIANPDNKFESYRRQLNVYGWIKGKGLDKGVFLNPHFHRDHPEEFANIKRRPRPGEREEQEQCNQTKGINSGGKSHSTSISISATNINSGSDKAEAENADASDDDDVNQAESDSEAGEDIDYDLSTLEAVDSKSLDDASMSEASPGNRSVARSDGSNTNEQQAEEPTPEPKFRPYQKVYARDKDGVIYEAVVRRQMFGQNHHKQVQIGLVESIQEAEELLKDNEPGWHYFIHYGKWSVNFDRWVGEDNVFEPTEKTKTYAARVLQEHRLLRQVLTKKHNGKKGYQTIDGAEFLREWKKRLTIVDAEMQIGNQDSGSVVAGADLLAGEDVAAKADWNASETAKPLTKVTLPKKDSWTKATLALERKLREKNLTTKRKQAYAFSVVIPLSLKKTMVDQWEIVSQCDMLPSLPSSVTVRQALDKYLASKGIEPHSSEKEEPEKKEKETKEDTPTETAPETEALLAADTDAAPMDTTNVNTPAATGTPMDTMVATKKINADEQGWIDMANGIAMLFDEALASRLLYCQELPQLRVLDSLPDYALKPYSEIYGCEHLLRMFVRLPALLADELTDTEARPILAKVNDFLRFLNKNQPALLVQNCRKLNDLELLEQQKIAKVEERKRKRQETMVAAAAAIAVPQPVQQ